MTTITREQQKQILIDTANHVISRDNTSPYSENLRELARIALASLEAEPIGAFHIADQQVGGTSDYIKDGEWPIDNGVIDVYAVPPVQETGVYKDMLNIIGLLEKNEWAEHCTSTVLGSLLESEITRLVSKEQPTPVVPEKLPCSVELKPGLIIGKGCKTETLLTALRRRAEYYAKLEAMTPEEREKHGASIEAFKAMLPQPAPVDKEFIPKNLDKALGVVGVALPESKEEFNFQIERWIQRLIDRVIRYADEFKEQPAPVVPDEMATSDDMNLYQKSFAQGYNACRNAMLNGGKS
ncbi:DUF550 domain-containing protein [Salmonella enterica subsp. enterica serovar Gdansk]|nr:DUF550 domain-containing protein [Salmonella enterica subsp. enterica serovar Gdansk]